MKKWIIGLISAVVLGCGIVLFLMWGPDPLVELVALPFYPIFARSAPEGTGGHVGESKWGTVSGAGPLSVSCSRVNWKEYTDEKGVKRHGPVAKLHFSRDDDEKNYEFIDVYAGQHINWNIFSLYVEKIVLFPAYVRFRTYINVPPIGQNRHGEFVEYQYPLHISSAARPAQEGVIPKKVGFRNPVAP